jgi:hypothetical protein
MALAVKVPTWMAVEWIAAVTVSPGLNPPPWIMVD